MRFGTIDGCIRGRVFCSALLIAAALITGACSRRAQQTEPQRIAFLRFENFTGEPSADWMGRGFSEVLTECVSGSPDIYAIPSGRFHAFERTAGPRPVSAPGISSERDLAIVAGANRLAYGEYSDLGGRLRVRLTIEDARTDKMRSLAAEAAQGDAIGAANALCRQIWSAAPGYLTSNNAALRAYVAALESAEPATINASLDQAIAADPDFAAPYRLLAQSKAQAEDRVSAARIIEAALSKNIRPPARARLQFMLSELRGDTAGRLQTLRGLTQAQPSDPELWRSLGDALSAARQYQGAAQAYGRALQIEPQDVIAMNQMGYAQAHAGDLDSAVKTLNRYGGLRPTEANPLDSLGDVYLLAGRLREAEQSYLAANSKSPHFQQDGPLFKAALARLMAGDPGGANALAQRYFEARKSDNDPAIEYRRAEWTWATGKREEACLQMENAAKSYETGPLRDLGARAYAELAVWRLLLGDQPSARRLSARAAAIAGPGSAALAGVTRFLVQPPASAEEWIRRAGDANNPVQQYALAYALLLNRYYGPAAGILERLYTEGAQSDGEGLPVLLAWAYMETGRVQQAEPLLRSNPIPSASGTGPFFAFYFPRLFQLRARVLRAQGKAGDAQASQALFDKLSGPLPLVWEQSPR